MEGREYQKREKAWEPQQACAETVETELRKIALSNEIRTVQYFEQMTRGTDLNKPQEDSCQM